MIVAALTREDSSSRVQAWLGAQAEGKIAISDWVTTEFSSALSIKLRRRDIDQRVRAAVLATYTQLANSTFTSLPFAAPQFHAAAGFANQETLGLRGGDALHLAICAHHGATLCTLDDRLAIAGPHVGVGTTRP